MSQPALRADAPIAIVGAGPAGLSAAWFLREQGYTNVTVLERAGRIGGLCETITENGHSYDLGANYITWQYTETRRIARAVGAETYFEDPYSAMKVPADPAQPVQYENFLQAMRVDDRTGQTVPVLRYAGLALKYLWLRLGLSAVIDRPSFAGVEQHPDLCKPFSAWLDDHGLGALRRLFEIPVTIMGYGTLDEIATPYVLKYIGPRTFVPMLLFGVPVLRHLMPWPRRFVQGFQRMWQRVSWQLNVRTNIDVMRIERQAGGVRIHFRDKGQLLDRSEKFATHMDFERVLIACQLCPPVLGRMMALTEPELKLFGDIKTHTYTMYTATVRNLKLPSPIVVTFPLAPEGTPWGVTQQWKDQGSFVTQFYVQLPGEDCTAQRGSDDYARVAEACERLIGQMGGQAVPESQAWRSFDAYPYFQHVTVEAFRRGWYTELEALQGLDRTYYLGGATSFELIEPIVQYAKHIVQTHFPRPAG